MPGVTVSGHARRVADELREAGGSLRIGELSGSPADIGPLLGELVDAGVVELVGVEDEPRATAPVTAALRSATWRAQVQREVRARLVSAAGRTALRVPSGT